MLYQPPRCRHVWTAVIALITHCWALLLALPSDFYRMRFDHPDDQPDDRSGAVWTDGPSNVSRPDSSGAVQADAEHPSRNRALRHEKWRAASQPCGLVSLPCSVPDALTDTPSRSVTTCWVCGGAGPSAAFHASASPASAMEDPPRLATIGNRRCAHPAANPTSCQRGRPGNAALISTYGFMAAQNLCKSGSTSPSAGAASQSCGSVRWPGDAVVQ
jgi:hypothetical protein